MRRHIVKPVASATAELPAHAWRVYRADSAGKPQAHKAGSAIYAQTPIKRRKRAEKQQTNRLAVSASGLLLFFGLFGWFLVVCLVVVGWVVGWF